MILMTWEIWYVKCRFWLSKSNINCQNNCILNGDKRKKKRPPKIEYFNIQGVLCDFKYEEITKTDYWLILDFVQWSKNIVILCIKKQIIVFS